MVLCFLTVSSSFASWNSFLKEKISQSFLGLLAEIRCSVSVLAGLILTRPLSEDGSPDGCFGAGGRNRHHSAHSVGIAHHPSRIDPIPGDG